MNNKNEISILETMSIHRMILFMIIGVFAFFFTYYLNLKEYNKELDRDVISVTIIDTMKGEYDGYIKTINLFRNGILNTGIGNSIFLLSHNGIQNYQALKSRTNTTNK